MSLGAYILNTMNRVSNTVRERLNQNFIPMDYKELTSGNRTYGILFNKILNTYVLLFHDLRVADTSSYLLHINGKRTVFLSPKCRNHTHTHTHTQTFAFKHIFVSYVHHRQGRYKSLSILIAPRR